MNLDDSEPKTESAKKADDAQAETMRDIATSPPAKTLDTIAAATNAVAPDAPDDDPPDKDRTDKDGKGEDGRKTDA